MSQLNKTNVYELAIKYHDKDACLKLLEGLRYPNGVYCDRCGSVSVNRLENQQKFQCRDCRYIFSVTAGTMFHRSHIPLQKWILAVFLICNAKKGISAKQIERDLKLTYKTAWYLMHRIRRAMREPSFLQKFTGIIEADETFIGAPKPGVTGRGALGKMIVLGAIERGGRVMVRPAPDTSRKSIASFIRYCVDKDANLLIADQWPAYNTLGREFRMARINHSYEYVRGQIHTNTIENFWSVLKRGIYGVYQQVSHKYLPLYLAEFSYRFNRRQYSNFYLNVLRNGLMYERPCGS